MCGFQLFEVQYIGTRDSLVASLLKFPTPSKCVCHAGPTDRATIGCRTAFMHRMSFNALKDFKASTQAFTSLTAKCLFHSLRAFAKHLFQIYTSIMLCCLFQFVFLKLTWSPSPYFVSRTYFSSKLITTLSVNQALNRTSPSPQSDCIIPIMQFPAPDVVDNLSP